jgi:antitoxin VapB
MGTEYRAKIFKAGNSVALRLPKALGMQEGSEVILRADDNGYTFALTTAPKRKIDISKFAGKMPWLEPLVADDFEESPRDWALLKPPLGKA